MMSMSSIFNTGTVEPWKFNNYKTGSRVGSTKTEACYNNAIKKRRNKNKMAKKSRRTNR